MVVPIMSCFNKLIIGACYDLAIAFGSKRENLAAFSLAEMKTKYELPTLKTWEGRDAFFLGILTPPDANSCLYIINCKCVMESFKESDGNLHKLIVPDLNVKIWTCNKEDCCSASCNNCHEKEKEKNREESRYKCPFDCTNKQMYNKFNNLKRRDKKLLKAEADTKHCDDCGITQKEYFIKHPYNRTMVWTSVPKTQNTYWCNACRVKNEGRGRASLINRRRQLDYAFKFKDMDKDLYEKRIGELDEEGKREAESKMNLKRKGEGGIKRTIETQEKPHKKSKQRKLHKNRAVIETVIEEEDDTIQEEQVIDEVCHAINTCDI